MAHHDDAISWSIKKRSGSSFIPLTALHQANKQIVICSVTAELLVQLEDRLAIALCHGYDRRYSLPDLDAARLFCS